MKGTFNKALLLSLLISPVVQAGVVDSVKNAGSTVRSWGSDYIVSPVSEGASAGYGWTTDTASAAKDSAVNFCGDHRLEFKGAGLALGTVAASYALYKTPEMFRAIKTAYTGPSADSQVNTGWFSGIKDAVSSACGRCKRQPAVTKQPVKTAQPVNTRRAARIARQADIRARKAARKAIALAKKAKRSDGRAPKAQQAPKQVVIVEPKADTRTWKDAAVDTYETAKDLSAIAAKKAWDNKGKIAVGTVLVGLAIYERCVYGNSHLAAARDYAADTKVWENYGQPSFGYVADKASAAKDLTVDTASKGWNATKSGFSKAGSYIPSFSKTEEVEAGIVSRGFGAVKSGFSKVGSYIPSWSKTEVVKGK